MTKTNLTITPLNLRALIKTFGGEREIKNGTICPTLANSLRRCLKAGLLEVVGGRHGTLRLTDEGVRRVALATPPAVSGPRLEVVQRNFDKVEIEMIEGALRFAANVNPLLGDGGAVPVVIKANLGRRNVEEKLAKLGPDWACEWDNSGDFAAIVKVAL